eukprot:6688129-Prorocentrum_lima.AAC.1
MPRGPDELPEDMKEESTMEAINPGNLVNMDDEEKEHWIDAIKAELKLFEDLDVLDEVTQEEAHIMKREGSQ